MGILNVTPDSFSDGGFTLSPRKATTHALRMEAEGVNLIDVGGESTRPGAKPVSAKEELKRILPVLERLVNRLHIPISVDTYKAEVAQKALEAGASLINDVTALRDPRMPEVVTQAKVPVILMHMRGTPQMMRQLPPYRRLLPEVLKDLKRSIAKALEFGIARDKILIDPGIGFGKNPKENLLLLKNLNQFKALGYPVVIGPSRKSFIGAVLGAAVHDRLWGTAAAVTLGVTYGADIVRVHDVAAMRQVVTLTNAILQPSSWTS